jgi:hypothetical protein
MWERLKERLGLGRRKRDERKPPSEPRKPDDFDRDAERSNYSTDAERPEHTNFERAEKNRW